MRIAIVGNSGAGKSTLARALADRHGLAHLDLDTVAWEPGGAAVPRPRASAARNLRAFCEAHAAWVVEGCYAELVHAALAFAPALCWIDAGVEACVAHARARSFEPHKFGSPEQQDAQLADLIAWIRGYPDREGDLGRRAHAALFASYPGPRCRMTDAEAGHLALAPRCVGPSEHRIVPWKNGRGHTTEIASWPPGASVQAGFEWRVSRAVIAQDGPFSSFPGIDRTLLLLDGELDLALPTGDVPLRAGDLVRFAGEDVAVARLRGGAAADLNVMVERSRFAHEASVVCVDGATSLGAGAPLLAVSLAGEPHVAGFALAPGALFAGLGAFTANGRGRLLVARLAPRCGPVEGAVPAAPGH